MIILGIDPGSVRVGYGVIEASGNKIKYVRSGLLKTGKSLSESLRAIELDLEKIIRETKPERAGIEKLFFVKNQKTGIRVAEARGVLLNTVAKAGLKIVELAPTEVKLAVTGNGSASKEAVAKMVRYFVRLPENKTADDVTDALAIAIAAAGERWEGGLTGATASLY